MALSHSRHTVTSCTDKQLHSPQENYDTDCEYSATSQHQQAESLHPNVIKQIEKLLQKALKQASDHITEKLTKEICDLGQRT